MTASLFATVHLDTQHHVGPIDRRVFGGFLEHLGRAVYEGVYDPGSPLSDERGFRTDVLDALRPLGMPIMRYPGGNFVSAYDWRDGIGPRDRRPTRPDFAWKSIETNQFGTDEFMAWCEALGTEPMLAVNLGTGSIADAAQLVEYCNLREGTYWADRRKEHGRAEPYGVKLWCLGNEMDGPWQAGHCSAQAYAERAAQAAILMKGLDPTIQTVACGSSGRGLSTYMHWDRIVLEHCWNHVDYISAHRYGNNQREDTPWYLAEGAEVDRILQDYAGLLDYVRGVMKSDKRVYVSFDEWNAWNSHKSNKEGNWTHAPHLLEEVYTLEDALVAAQFLSAFIRRADVVKVACLAQIVNVIAPILTRPDGLLIQTIYYPFALYSRNISGVSLTPVVTSPTYAAGERGETPALDAVASYDEASGAAAIGLVNRSQTQRLTVEVRIADARVTNVIEASALGGGDVKAMNTWENPQAVTPTKADATLEEGRLRVTVPSPGMAVVRVELERR